MLYQPQEREYSKSHIVLWLIKSQDIWSELLTGSLHVTLDDTPGMTQILKIP